MALVLLEQPPDRRGRRRRRDATLAAATRGRWATLLYTDYVYPFEIAAVILLVAIIAAIVLTHRQRRETKYQDPAAAGEGAGARPAAGAVDAVGEERTSYDSKLIRRARRLRA